MENVFGLWIQQNGLSKHAVAVAFDVGDPAIWKLTRHGFQPNRDNLMRIWRFTGGEVTPDAMLLEGQPPPKESAEYRRGLRAIQAAQEEKEATHARRKTKKKQKPGAESGRAAEQRLE